jgi:hypothetical protein
MRSFITGYSRISRSHFRAILLLTVIPSSVAVRPQNVHEQIRQVATPSGKRRGAPSQPIKTVFARLCLRHFVAKSAEMFKSKGFATRSQHNDGIGYRAGKSDTPLCIVVAELRFLFRCKWTRGHSDDPRLRCGWRLAMGISTKWESKFLLMITISLTTGVFRYDIMCSG